MKFTDLSNRFHKTIGFERFVENEFTTRYSGIHVIRRFGDK